MNVSVINQLFFLVWVLNLDLFGFEVCVFRLYYIVFMNYILYLGNVSNLSSVLKR